MADQKNWRSKSITGGVARAPNRAMLRAVGFKDGELSVNTLADVVGKSPAAVSQHLAKLRLARIVMTRHEGNRVFYRLANEHPLELVTDAMFQAEHSLDDQPRHHNRTRQEGNR